MKVVRRPDLGEFVYEYTCTCGEKIILYTDEAPKKLIKCWDCICKEQERRDKELEING